jgi:hypothetical protein
MSTIYTVGHFTCAVEEFNALGWNRLPASARARRITPAAKSQSILVGETRPPAEWVDLMIALLNQDALAELIAPAAQHIPTSCALKPSFDGVIVPLSPTPCLFAASVSSTSSAPKVDAYNDDQFREPDGSQITYLSTLLAAPKESACW